MSQLTILYLPNLDALRFHAPRWDDLWRRSPVTHPTARAGLIASWIERFCPQGRFQAVAVCQDGRFVAALPLLMRRKGHLISCLDVPGNEWSSAGQLLLDADVDRPHVCDRLIEGLHQLACPVFWFASIPLFAPSWQLLSEAAERAHWNVDRRARYQVGRLELAASWHQQQSLLSRGFRKQLGRSMRGLQARGSLQLHFSLPHSESAAMRLLAEGLRLEHAGWKGAAGTSLLAHVQTAQFARQQARELAEQHQLAMVFLQLAGQPIAFELGWLAKQVYHSYKVGFDPRFSRWGPGQVLVYLLLQRFHAKGEARTIDFLGPLEGAVRRWHPACYPMGKLLLAPPRLLGKAIVFASKHFSAGDDLQLLTPLPSPSPVF